MSKKIFAVSDVHGHYSEMMSALCDAGFDADNADHVFISCGDLFDRGTENVRVYDFVKNLKHKILIRGNHEDMLRLALSNGRITGTDIYNGTDISIAEFLREEPDENGFINKEAHADMVDELLSFIDSMDDYYETDNYVFTHGWLPIVFDDDDMPAINPCWRNSTPDEWKYARFLEWHQLYDAKAMLDGKTIVCGHRPARLGILFDMMREPDCSEPFYGNGIVAIDAGTVRSGRVNVFTTEID
jgi:serine/threonine protein phosphatase 1